MFQYPSTVPDNPNPPQMLPAIPHLHHPRIKPDPDIENAVVTANVCMNNRQPIYSVEVPNKYVYIIITYAYNSIYKFVTIYSMYLLCMYLIVSIYYVVIIMMHIESIN